MSLRYTHTLIPRSPQFVPSPVQVQAFLSAMISRGVMGGEVGVIVRYPSAHTREVRNPFTGELEVHRVTDRQELKSVNGVAEAVAKSDDYRAGVSGMGRPKNPPLPLDFDDEYHTGVTCRVSPRLCCTCDVHEESGRKEKLPFYGKPCDRVIRRGVFSNPHTMEVIEVPSAGCARFWVEFDLGKSVFPVIAGDNLSLLDPEIVAEAEREFGVKFSQGCAWG